MVVRVGVGVGGVEGMMVFGVGMVRDGVLLLAAGVVVVGVVVAGVRWTVGGDLGWGLDLAWRILLKWSPGVDGLDLFFLFLVLLMSGVRVEMGTWFGSWWERRFWWARGGAMVDGSREASVSSDVIGVTIFGQNRNCEPI